MAGSRASPSFANGLFLCCSYFKMSCVAPFAMAPVMGKKEFLRNEALRAISKSRITVIRKVILLITFAFLFFFGSSFRGSKRRFRTLIPPPVIWMKPIINSQNICGICLFRGRGRVRLINYVMKYQIMR